MAERLAPDTLPPHIRLIQLATAIWPSKTLYVAARLGLADCLTDTRKNVDELSELTNTRTPSMTSLLTALVHLGILTKDSNDTFALTSRGTALRTGAPGCARAVILLMAQDRIGARRVVAASRKVKPMTTNGAGLQWEVQREAQAKAAVHRARWLGHSEQERSAESGTGSPASVPRHDPSPIEGAISKLRR